IEDGQDGGHAGVLMRDCVGGEEGGPEQPVIVDGAVIPAALRTGLFNARGPDRFGFAHRTYGEFLAARFLTRLHIPAAQLENLVCLQDRTPLAYVPQLQEVV